MKIYREHLEIIAYLVIGISFILEIINNIYIKLIPGTFIGFTILGLVISFLSIGFKSKNKKRIYLIKLK